MAECIVRASNCNEVTLSIPALTSKGVVLGSGEFYSSVLLVNNQLV